VTDQRPGRPASRRLPPVTADALFEAMRDAGILRTEDKIRRIIIDIAAGKIVVMHIERYADRRLLEVVSLLGGAEIRTAEPSQGEPRDDRDPAGDSA
jgi:hypothetical protein